jgi:hypothetical protein
VLKDLDGVLFKIEQASDIVLEVAQPLHDNEKTHYIITRLSYCTQVIDEASTNARKLNDGVKKFHREAAVQA